MDSAESIGGGRDLTIERRPAGRLWSLRLRGATEDRLAAVASAAGIPIPADAVRTGFASDGVLTLSPEEWLLRSEAPPTLPAPRESEGGSAHLVEVGDGYVAYSIEGARAADLLAKGCTLDFHRAVFRPGSCAQSALAQVYVIVVRTTGDGFELLASSSYRAHLDLWFADAALEFQIERLRGCPPGS